jgi:hypothetical protein
MTGEGRDFEYFIGHSNTQKKKKNYKFASESDIRK